MVKLLLWALSGMAVCPFSIADTPQHPLVAAVIDLPPYGCKVYDNVCYHNRFFSGLEGRLSNNIEQITLPYARAVAFAKSGHVDLILIGKHNELENTAVNVGTLYTLEFSLVSKVPIEQLRDLEKYQVGVIRAAKSTISRVTSINFSHLYEVDNYQVAFDMMEMGRLDAFFTPTHSANLLPPHVTVYLANDFNLQPWILEVVLYCRPSVCDVNKKAALQRELHLLRNTFLID